MADDSVTPMPEEKPTQPAPVADVPQEAESASIVEPPATPGVENSVSAPVDEPLAAPAAPAAPAVPEAPAVPPAPPYPTPVTTATTGADKNKIAAGLFGILLGGLGIHKFYLGYTKEGVIMLAVSVLSLGILPGVVGLIGLFEGILYLTKSDEEFYTTYVANRRPWL